MKIGRGDWSDFVTRLPPARRITIPLAEPGLMLRETGNWLTAMIIPQIPAGEAEYDPVEIQAAMEAGEDLTWERIGPNLCRIVRIPRTVPQEEAGR